MITVAPRDPADDAAWDRLVEEAPMGTLLHTRAFLGYHGERLRDVSLTVHHDRGGLIGVMPAAVDPRDASVVASHPGVTFGGVVHDGPLAGPAMIEAIAAAAVHYRAGGFARLRYAPVPAIYHRRPSADDLYALFRLGAARVRCDLSCAVDLQESPSLSARRRRGLAKAQREGVAVAEGGQLVDDLWPIVEANLAERHAARPVHSRSEIRALISRLPEHIAVVVARHDGAPVAGVVVFDGPRVSHAQYIASSPAGNAVGALDAVFARCMARAAERRARYFDFGTSNRDEGRVLNDGLYGFKSQFGGGGVAYEHYELDVSAATPKPVSP
jgi:hypothetical protein